MPKTTQKYKTHTNSYFVHRIAESPQEASILSNEQTWSVLEILRDAGAKGLTSIEVAKEIEKIEGVHISRSKIYSILKKLYEYEWIHRYYDSEVKSQRNTVTEHFSVGVIDDDFFDLIDDKMKRVIENNLFPNFDKLFEETVQKLEDDSESKNWLPDHGKNSFCRFCKINHEAEEFVIALLSIAISSYIESDNFKRIVIKKKYADEKFEPD